MHLELAQQKCHTGSAQQVVVTYLFNM